MSALMNAVMMFLTAVVSLIAISIAFQSNRTIDRIEEIQSQTIEAVNMTKQEMKNRIDQINRVDNVWHERIEGEIEKITKRMDELAKSCGRLDEIDFRSKEAAARASDAARCVILNGSSSNSGVIWADQYPDQEEHHAENDA